MTHFRRVETTQVERQSVVLDSASVLGLVLPHDTEDAIAEPLRAVYRLAVDHVAGALLLVHIRRHPQPGDAIDTAATGWRTCRVVVQDDHLIAQEVRGFSVRVRDQRLLFGKLQLECLMQERSDLTLDRLGF